jgi:hypothetical protein
MEPIKINVNIEVGLKQSTIDTLRLFFGPQITSAGPCFCALDEEPQPEKPTDPTPTPEPEKPKTVGADPDGTGAEYDDDDLPPGDAPDPVTNTPTESDARNAVAAAKKRGVKPATIRNYLKTTFEISSSVECPAKRRQELIDGLNKLTA